MEAIEKMQQLERSLQEFRQFQLQSLKSSKVDPSNPWTISAIQEAPDLSASAHPLQSLFIIARIARSILRITDEQTAKLGISQTKLAALMFLSSEPQQSASPSAIAKYCGVSRAAVTGLLDGLEQEAYVERDSHPFDRRALTIKLTSKGQEFLSLISLPDQLSALMSTLSEDDRQKINELLSSFNQLFNVSSG